MNYKDLLTAIASIESDRSIDKTIIIDALTDALEKAYRKQLGVPDALVEARVNEKTGEISLFRQYRIVEEVEDPEQEMELAATQSNNNNNLQLGELFEIEESVDNLSRPAALLAKNVLKQKIREAEKQGIYDEYITQLGDLITVSIETIEEKFMIVNLGKTLGLLPKSGQIPNERYYEGQKIKVIISEVNRDTKGAQILVSRADEQLVRRLFEREIPEIFQGLVEIKAIARDAGERTKIAVYSKHPDIDALGACIGPGGARVHEIIDEIRGEKIDVFEWSDDIVELVKNALAPAKVMAVIPAENNRSILVVVDDNQLSLAIGKKGKNARLAVKLTGKKIDIKTPAALTELGINYLQLQEAYQNRILEAEVLKKIVGEDISEILTEEVITPVSEPETEVEKPVEEIKLPVKEKPAVVTEAETVKKPVEAPAIEKEPTPVKTKKTRVSVDRGQYVSKFEKLADASRPSESTETASSKRRKAEEEDRRKRDAEIRKEKEYEIKPEYSEEELEEIRRQEELDELSTWVEEDIDFDEFEDFYD